MTTQNDWDGELYKVACHIHAESMAYKVGMPGADDPEMSIYKRLKTLLADAGKEEKEGIARWFETGLDGKWNGKQIAKLIRSLATLREETK